MAALRCHLATGQVVGPAWIALVPVVGATRCRVALLLCCIIAFKYSRLVLVRKMRLDAASTCMQEYRICLWVSPLVQAVGSGLGGTPSLPYPHGRKHTADTPPKEWKCLQWVGPGVSRRTVPLPWHVTSETPLGWWASVGVSPHNHTARAARTCARGDILWAPHACRQSLECRASRPSAQWGTRVHQACTSGLRAMAGTFCAGTHAM